MQIEFDSDDEDSGDSMGVGDAIGPMIDAEITFVMDDQGNVSDVSIPDEVVEGMESAGGGMGGQMFSKDQLEQMVQASNLVFPEDPVAEGVEWENETSQKSPLGEMKLKSNYKYAGTEQKDGATLHKIDVTSEITLEDGTTQFGGSVELDESESTGQIWFDNEKGHMVSSSATQKMTMVMDIMGQELDMEMSSKTVVKMTPVK